MFIIMASSKSDSCFEPTQQMRDWFDRRTKYHIGLVKKYCKKIEDYDPERFKGLSERGEDHDKSKFDEPEVDPYIYISWRYRCKARGQTFDVAEDLDEKMMDASEHHVKNNRHHPEFHTPQKGDLLNHDNRDKPSDKVIDATAMTDLDIGEMCADWMAMSEELDDDPNEWAKKNINVRWKFTERQENLIYELIKAVFGQKRR